MVDANTPGNVFPLLIKSQAENTFLELAKHLREVQDNAPDDFYDFCKQLKIGLRKGYALAKIDRAFRHLNLPRDRMLELGWTRLAMLSPFVSSDNVEALLKLAETHRAHDLRLALRGEEIDPEAKIVMLYLRKEQLALLERALIAHGAIRHRHGWHDKEGALIRALTKVLPPDT